MKQKSVYRNRLLRLAVPIVIQNILSAAVGSTDVIMLNFVSQDAISAVSLASQVGTILFMFFYGLGTGATMLCSQYWGKGDSEAVRNVQGIAMRISLGISALFFLAAELCPRLLMRIFTNEEALIRLGIDYLRWVGIAYLCWSICEVYLSVLRSIGRVTVSMVLNILAFSLNIGFNAVFIFGLFGAPKLGAAGVALGTSLSRLVELIGCLIVSSVSRDIRLEPKYLFVRNKVLSEDFRKMALPALANDIIWGLAFSVYSIILGHLGTDAVAANSLVTVVRNFGTTMCFGVASAGGILLGQLLGDNKKEAAEEAAHELVIVTLWSAVLGSLVILIASPFVLHFADITKTALGYLRVMLLINAYYVFGPAINTTMICGIFRSGGDSRYGLIVDLIDMWCYAVPLGLFAAFVLKLPVLWVYFLMCTDEFAKWPWVIRHYKKKGWLLNITREYR